MASYDLNDAAWGPGRVPENVEGAEVWQQVVGTEFLNAWRTAYLELRRRHDARAYSTPSLRCPRVFISHRQKDTVLGRRVAWLAAKARFQFWLDDLDPHLASVPALRLNPDLEALIIACLIEIALLNCSHVLAVITPRTRGSMWVPYEYGRVKTLPAGSQAACWIAPRSRRTPQTPEYLLLGKISRSESEIRTWFSAELRHWASSVNRACVGGSTGEWPRHDDELT